MIRPLLERRLVPPLAAVALAAAAPALAADTVGPEACATCHPAAAEVWKAGPHAHAERGLGTRGNEPACLVCHAPQRADGIAGVSCEACHGPGGHYAKSYVMRDRELARAVGLKVPGERECRTCHDATSPSLAPFDHAQKLRLVQAHAVADRQARKGGPRAVSAAAAKPAGAGKLRGKGGERR